MSIYMYILKYYADAKSQLMAPKIFFPFCTYTGESKFIVFPTP